LLQDFGDSLGSLRNTVERKTAEKDKLIMKFQQTCNIAIAELVRDISKTLDMLLVSCVFLWCSMEIATNIFTKSLLFP